MNQYGIAPRPIPIAAGDQIFSEYDLDRAVTAVRLDHCGNIWMTA